MNFKDWSIRMKFIVIFILVISLLIIPSIILLRGIISDEAKEAAVEKAKSDLLTGYAILNEKDSGDWRLEGNKLYKGNTLISGNNEVVDYIGELTNDVVTIFANDTRVTTNVKENGKRAVGTAVSVEVAETVLGKGEDYYGEANVVGSLYQTAYTPIKDKDGKIIGIWSVATSKEFVNKMINNAIKGLTYVFLIVLVITIPLILFSSKLIADPIIDLSQIINKLADFDLRFDENSKTVNYLDRKDEIGQITNSLVTMQKNLNNLINDVKDAANQVAASSEELSASGEQVGETAEQVGSAIENVASGAEEQSAQIEETSKNVEHMISQVKEVNSSSVNMISSAKTVMGKIKEGKQSVDKSINEIDNVKGDVQGVAGIIESLGKASGEIGGIVEIINSIANQTNLLALNAAIEAARAGEAGKGFSVVAEEIRGLAEDSTKSTEKIANLIKQIQHDVSEAVKKMDKSMSTVNSSVVSIEENGQIFNDINQVSNELMELITGVNEKSKELAENSDKISQAIKNVAAVSQEAAGNAEEVAASSEEQIASTEEIVSGARELADVADKLANEVDKFKL
ncbi:MAG: HAMP domain-containing protein [Firmicutes bacterium]|nr:HAMP domain-containing protein [Bacillota bacterium]